VVAIRCDTEPSSHFRDDGGFGSLTISKKIHHTGRHRIEQMNAIRTGVVYQNLSIERMAKQARSNIRKKCHARLVTHGCMEKALGPGASVVSFLQLSELRSRAGSYDQFLD
jgi:RNA 3'-terminal phosphate cyclase